MDDRAPDVSHEPEQPAPDLGLDHYVTVDDLRFHYRSWGSDQAFPLLLIHGLTGNSWEWGTVARELAKRHRVLAFDQRGHGATDWAADYSVDLLAEDIGSLMDALGIERAAVVGHSLGGNSAYCFAAAHPDRVTRLVIVDIAPPALAGPRQTGAIRAWLQELTAAAHPGREHAVDAWKSMNPTARDAELWEYVRHNMRQDRDGSWRWRFDGVGLQRLLDGVDEARLWEAVRGVECPSLVIRGSDSPILDRETADRMVRELRHGSLAEIPGGGHDLTVERPEALAAAVLGFLGAG